MRFAHLMYFWCCCCCCSLFTLFRSFSFFLRRLIYYFIILMINREKTPYSTKFWWKKNRNGLQCENQSKQNLERKKETSAHTHIANLHKLKWFIMSYSRQCQQQIKKKRATSTNSFHVVVVALIVNGQMNVFNKVFYLSSVFFKCIFLLYDHLDMERENLAVGHLSFLCCCSLMCSYFYCCFCSNHFFSLIYLFRLSCLSREYIAHTHTRKQTRNTIAKCCDNSLTIAEW